ncbi:MAG: methyltransferase [Candidatus Delongbacteria bacterium]|jgi:23S rRNA (guanine1835-N2)-methyltransferase|nr:methyltransferase [Candidatus Delongbacteria bacterium]
MSENLDNKYSFKRYDLADDKTLKAWSAADEYILETFDGLESKPDHLAIYNDRFGFLACYLHSVIPTMIITNKSQEKTIDRNLKANDLPMPHFANPLSVLDNKIDIAFVKIPKSLGLFQLFLEHITQNSTDDITVFCGFMTRYFTPNLLQIAQEYFEVVEQSRAQKKARLLILKKKKETVKKDMITSLTYKEQEYRQYQGVFSAEHIDYATQFFLDHLEVKETDQCILDLASGNGVIGNEIFKKFPEAEIHLMDDSFLAVSSAELNIQGEHIHHHFNNDLSIFEDDTFDLIVTNPPFHFEYEINIQITLGLFRGCYKCLKVGGSLQVVANKHLYYKVHLERLFTTVQVLAVAKKFVVYKCAK